MDDKCPKCGYTTRITMNSDYSPLHPPAAPAQGPLSYVAETLGTAHVMGMTPLPEREAQTFVVAVATPAEASGYMPGPDTVNSSEVDHIVATTLDKTFLAHSPEIINGLRFAVTAALAVARKGWVPQAAVEKPIREALRDLRGHVGRLYSGNAMIAPLAEKHPNWMTEPLTAEEQKALDERCVDPKEKRIAELDVPLKGE